MAIQNPQLMRQNLRALHHLLQFKEDKPKEPPAKSDQPIVASIPDAVDRACRWRAKAEE
jgi:hypothetical protein